MKKKRFYDIFRYGLLILILGCIYGIVVEWTGYGIPCVFNKITGLKCPGCGITHMCIALLHLNFKEAFASNQMIMLLLPVFDILLLQYVAGYIKTGIWHMNKVQTVIIYVCIALLFGFAIVRNLFSI